MPNRRDHLDLRAIVIMVVCCFCWGLNQVAIKVANAGISPVLQAGLRGVVATVLLLIWSKARGIRLGERDGSLWLGLALGVVFSAEFVLLYWGIAFTTASRAIVFMYLAPFVVAIGVHRFVPGERLGAVQVAGLFCAFAGMLVAFGDGLSLPTRTQLLGDLMVVGAALLWGSTTVMVKATRLIRISPEKALLYQLGASALLLPPLSLAVGEPGFTQPTTMALAAFVYSAVVVAFATYLTWYWLITHYPAARLSGFSFLAPLLGVIAGGVLLGERVGAALWAALVLVALGITLINRRPRLPEPASAAVERRAA